MPNLKHIEIDKQLYDLVQVGEKANEAFSGARGVTAEGKINKNAQDIKKLQDELIGEEIKHEIVSADKVIITGVTGAESGLVEDSVVQYKRLQGKTYKSVNKLHLKDQTSGIYTIKDGVIKVSSLQANNPIGIFSSKGFNGDYSFYASMDDPNYRLELSKNGTIILNYNKSDGVYNFSLAPSDTLSIRYYLLSGFTSFNQPNIPMLVEGRYSTSNKPDYEPYFDGLRNSKSNMISTGLNIWDEIWRNGYYNSGNNGAYVNDSRYVCCKNPIYVKENAKYSISGFPNAYKVLFYDRNDNLVGFGGNYTFTTPKNCVKMRFWINSDYGTTYKNDVMVNYDNPKPYEPYKGNEITWDIELSEYDYVDMVSNVKTNGGKKKVLIENDITIYQNGYAYIEKPKDSNDYGEYPVTIITDSSFDIGGGQSREHWTAYIPNSSLDEVKKLLKGTTIIYKLKTPTTEPLVLPQALPVYKYGQQAQTGYPYEITREYELNFKAQFNAMITQNAEQDVRIDKLEHKTKLIAEGRALTSVTIPDDIDMSKVDYFIICFNASALARPIPPTYLFVNDIANTYLSASTAGKTEDDSGIYAAYCELSNRNIEIKSIGYFTLQTGTWTESKGSNGYGIHRVYAVFK